MRYGQGAGVAAAISIKNDSIVRNTSVEKIQKELFRQGVSVFNPISKKQDNVEYESVKYESMNYKSKL